MRKFKLRKDLKRDDKIGWSPLRVGVAYEENLRPFEND